MDSSLWLVEEQLAKFSENVGALTKRQRGRRVGGKGYLLVDELVSIFKGMQTVCNRCTMVVHVLL